MFKSDLKFTFQNLFCVSNPHLSLSFFWWYQNVNFDFKMIRTIKKNVKRNECIWIIFGMSCCIQSYIYFSVLIQNFFIDISWCNDLHERSINEMNLSLLWKATRRTKSINYINSMVDVVVIWFGRYFDVGIWHSVAMLTRKTPMDFTSLSLAVFNALSFKYQYCFILPSFIDIFTPVQWTMSLKYHVNMTNDEVNFFCASLNRRGAAQF